jgi:hypothetical protein
MPITRSFFDVKWFKRYAIGCLVALFVLAGVDGYKRPGKDMRVGAIVAVSAAWPIFTAIVLGSSFGEIASEINQGKPG